MSDLVLETEKLDKILQAWGTKHSRPFRHKPQSEKRRLRLNNGPSGSGKTTLLNILGCFDKPINGKVILDDVDVTAVPEKELYKIRRYMVGFIFQTFNLLPYLSAIKNVELPMEGTGKSIREMHEKPESC